MKNKKSVEYLVYHTLKSAILSRELAPGNQLVEIPISNKLNISRTPVRNAIRKLSLEGLVNIVPNRGAFVINPTKEEIKQAYHLRKELEIIASKQAVHFLRPDDFKQMHQCIIEEEIALNQKNLIEYLKANKKFHMIIVEKSGNKFLIEFVEKLINETTIYLILFDTYFEELSYKPTGPIEHREIIVQLQQIDLPEIEKLLNTHYENAIEKLSVQNKTYKSVEELF